MPLHPKPDQPETYGWFKHAAPDEGGNPVVVLLRCDNDYKEEAEQNGHEFLEVFKSDDPLGEAAAAREEAKAKAGPSGARRAEPEAPRAEEAEAAGRRIRGA